MEASLCLRLRQQPLANSPLLLTSKMTTSIATNRHVTFSHPCLSLTNRYKWGSLRSIYCPITCTLNRSPMSQKKNGNDDHKKKVSVAGATVVLACVLGVIGSSCKMNPRAIAVGPMEILQMLQSEAAASPSKKTKTNAPGGEKAPDSSSKIYTRSGKEAMHNLLNMSMLLDSSKFECKDPMREPSFCERPILPDIKMEALRLSKCGKDNNDAVPWLRKNYELYKNGHHEAAYAVEMYLVEMLILQGKYDDTFLCDWLAKVTDQDVEPSDARIPLYQAIIYTMKNDKDKAVEWWERFMDTLDE